MATLTESSDPRYFDSKLLEVLYCQQFVEALNESKKPAITLNWLDPGFCHSELGRNPTFGSKVAKKILARTTEEGSRTLVAAVVPGNLATHGQYMSDAKIAKQVTCPFARRIHCCWTHANSCIRMSNWVYTAEGLQTSNRVWKEVNSKLEEIEPGILQNL